GVYEQNPRRVLRVAFPVAHAARRYAARAALLTFGTRNDEDPTLLAGLAVERDDAIAARHVHHAANDDRNGGGVAVQAIGPRSLEPAAVVRVDLIQRRVAGRGEISIDRAPVARVHPAIAGVGRIGRL